METNKMSRLRLDAVTLPDISRPEMDFLETSFFQNDTSPPPQLPTAASIIKRYGNKGRRVITIDELDMVVKINYESDLRLEEVQTMRAIRELFLHHDVQVPVPEVFGWRHHGEMIFIYMSLVHGKRLRQAWPDLTVDDKKSIQRRLSQIVTALRQITQENPDKIASVNGGTVQDRFFKPNHERGPFTSIKTFHDWMFATATLQHPRDDNDEIKYIDHSDMLRDLLPDTGLRIYFTHGDLTLGNIMVSGTPGSFDIVAIIDWEQAGWYPEYWEYCKMHFAAGLDHEWSENKWPDAILEPHEDAWFAFSEYTLWRGG